MDNQAISDIRRFESLKALRGNWDTQWQNIADYVMPRKSQISATKTPGVEGYTDRLFNTEAIRANQILAAGQKDYLFSGRWFAWEAPEELKEDDEANRWFAKCTDIGMRELARSNFLLCAHEMLLDRGAFGTGALYCEAGSKTRLRFVTDDIGSFCISEGEDGTVDTVLREFELTARQAAMRFGEDALGEKLSKALRDEKCMDQKFKFLHVIEPRTKYTYGKIDPENKPIASRYVCLTDKHTLQEGGFDEMPYFVTRFLKWGKEAYGYSPSFEALPTIRQVNHIEQQMDALAEIKAFPRVLVPAGSASDIDLRSGGVTEFDPNVPNALPQEWGTSGEYNIGLERIEKKNEAIRAHYHVDLFAMLQSIDREMTAYEVAQRVAEKVAAFSPTFYRLQVELFTPLLTRVFGVLFRSGAFPPPPDSVLVPVGDGSAVSIAVPEVHLTGKLAMLIREMETNGFLRLMNLVMPLTQVKPDILDNYDFDKAIRGVGRNLGIPVEWEVSQAERDEIRAARAQQAQQQQMIESAEAVGRASKDLRAGGVTV